MYLDADGHEIPASELETEGSGLFAMNRQGEIVKIQIPRNSLAFQIGESTQILSGGLL